MTQELQRVGIANLDHVQIKNDHHCDERWNQCWLGIEETNHLYTRNRNDNYSLPKRLWLSQFRVRLVGLHSVNACAINYEGVHVICVCVANVRVPISGTNVCLWLSVLNNILCKSYYHQNNQYRRVAVEIRWWWEGTPPPPETGGNSCFRQYTKHWMLRVRVWVFIDSQAEIVWIWSLKKKGLNKLKTQ